MTTVSLIGILYLIGFAWLLEQAVAAPVVDAIVSDER